MCFLDFPFQSTIVHWFADKISSTQPKANYKKSNFPKETLLVRLIGPRRIFENSAAGNQVVLKNFEFEALINPGFEKILSALVDTVQKRFRDPEYFIQAEDQYTADLECQQYYWERCWPIASN